MRVGVGAAMTRGKENRGRSRIRKGGGWRTREETRPVMQEHKSARGTNNEVEQRREVKVFEKGRTQSLR